MRNAHCLTASLQSPSLPPASSPIVASPRAPCPRTISVRFSSSRRLYPAQPDATIPRTMPPVSDSAPVNTPTPLSAHDARYISNFHPETQIRLVRAKPPYRLRISHTRKR